MTLLAHRSVVIFFLHLLRSLSVLTHHCTKLLVVHSTNVPTLVITCLLICSTYFQASPTDGLRGCSFPAIVLTDTLPRSTLVLNHQQDHTQRFSVDVQNTSLPSGLPFFFFTLLSASPSHPNRVLYGYNGVCACVHARLLCLCCWRS